MLISTQHEDARAAAMVADMYAVRSGGDIAQHNAQVPYYQLTVAGRPNYVTPCPDSPAGWAFDTTTDVFVHWCERPWPTRVEIPEGTPRDEACRLVLEHLQAGP